MCEHKDEGRKAFLAGMDYNTNPYSIYEYEQFLAALDWATGWREEHDTLIQSRIRGFNQTYDQNAAHRSQYD